LPAELVAGNELDPRVREMLPQIASYKPDVRNKALEKIKAYLIPGAQKTKRAGGFLPALGIVLQENRLVASATVLPVPKLIAAGVAVPEGRKENWAPMLQRANFNINPKQAITLNVVVIYHKSLVNGYKDVYVRIRDFVNYFNTFYRFPPEPFKAVEARDSERHWGAVEKCFGSGKVADNIFVLDFTKPRNSLDPAYPVVKHMLAKSGFLSQFVNFKTYQHEQPKDLKRSNIILQGVSRQILQKTGVRLFSVSPHV